MRATDIWLHRCPDEGQWMAFFDGEGKPTEREVLGAHLRSCTACQAIFESIGDTVMFADAALDLVHPTAARPYRRAIRWLTPVAAAAAVVLGLGIGFQSVGQNAMAAIASLFQVKTIGTVPVSPEQLAQLTRTVTQGGKVTLNYYGSVTVAGPMKQETVPLSELQSQHSMPNLWPQALGAASTATVQTGLRVTLKLNVSHINQLIQSQGGTDLFPMSLNQEPFTLVVPAWATVQSGPWTLEEVPQPTVVAPGKVPVAQVTKALENLPFLPPALQNAVARMADWRNTLILPLPNNPQNVAVAGTQGIVDSNRKGTTVGEAWVQKDGLVVAVMEHQATPVNRQAFVTEVAQLFR